MKELNKVLGEMEVGFRGGRSGAQKGEVGREDHDGRGEVGGTIDSALLCEPE